MCNSEDSDPFVGQALGEFTLMNREENLQTIYILHTNKNIKKKIITYSIVIEKKLETETHNIITQKYSTPPLF